MISKREATLVVLLLIPFTIYLLYQTGLLNAAVTTVSNTLNLNALLPSDSGPCFTYTQNSTKAAKGRTNRTDSMDFALNFIPANFSTGCFCDRMFPVKEVQAGEPKNFTEAYKKWNLKVIEIGKDPTWLFKTMNKDMQFGFFMDKKLMLIKLARIPCVQTICETGFKAGHSAMTFLMANPTANVYSFDTGLFPYSKGIAEYLSDLFPGRLHVIWGNSSETMPKFRSQFPSVKCDISLIDGEKTNGMAHSDFDNFKQMTSCHSVLVFNDCEMSSWVGWLKPAWNEWKATGKISEIFLCPYTYWGKGYCMGRFSVPECTK